MNSRNDSAPRAAAASILELVHALVADSATHLNVDYLVIKGTGAQKQGLQPVRDSADVDVLVRPSDLATFSAELERRGWLQRPADADVRAFPRHSTSYFHPSWSCDIDLHFRFPGMEGEPDLIFEALFAEHTTFEQAGFAVTRPSVAASTVFLALHYLRSPWVPRHATGLRELVANPALPLEDAVVAAASAVAGLACARPFIEAAYGTSDRIWGDPSAEWMLRTQLSSPIARRISLFATASVRERVRFVRLALFPPRETLLKMDATRDLSLIQVTQALAGRWWRGMRGLPQARREIRERETLAPFTAPRSPNR